MVRNMQRIRVRHSENKRCIISELQLLQKIMVLPPIARIIVGD